MNALSENRVVVTPPMLAETPELFAPLVACGLDVVFNSGPYPMPADALADCLHGAVAAVVGLDDLADSVFERCPTLRIVARNGVGMDTVDLNAATAHGVAVTVPLGANSTSVAELAFGLLLTLVRGIVANHNRVQGGVWRRDPGRELAGKTLGIIGLGRIGKKVARRALAFDMPVIAHDILPDEPFARAHGIAFVSRERLLAEADVVSLHVPLTPLTVDMLGQEAFGSMKPGAFLVNTARGPVVNADALVAALDSGTLAGAALDVHPVEGQIDTRLVGRPNVVTTTHLGAYTYESLAATTNAAVHSLCQFFSHQTPDGLANPEVLHHPVS
jgi:phosphoglycerate dehydrogenase-like enzyme